jgi:predicted enzyme related to lactoylglutathione lyase
MTAPPLGSILLASTDPARLMAWYVTAFDATVDIDGFLGFGSVSLLIDEHHDIADRCVEPGRMILNFHVENAKAFGAHLTGLGVTWLRVLEAREDGWFATLVDPDGNIIQIIELSTAYLTRGNNDREDRDG